MGAPYKTIAFYTLGCKLNYAGTSTLSREIVKFGYTEVNCKDQADVYVINSCSVTDRADKKTRKIIRQFLKHSPSALIVVVGCYAQLKPEEIASIPGVGLVIGAAQKFNLFSHLDAVDSNTKSIIIKSNVNNHKIYSPSFSIRRRTRSFLKIQDGCDYNCSFCTIPLARGRSRSASVSHTISEAEKISDAGVSEVVLTGVNIGDFGIHNKETLYDLIYALDKVNGICRYRISSIEPNLLTDEIISFVAQSEKFLPHFHIPLQSGSSTILKVMRRRYQSDLYSDRISAIKSLMPDASIGVDVIVGFPGEKDKQFQETYDLLYQLDVSYLHIFPYSERDNTDAIKIVTKVPSETIIERSKILRVLSNKKKRKFYEKNIGKVYQVLIENCEDSVVSGLTENYIRMKSIGNPKDINKIVRLQLMHIKGDIMIGQRIE